MAEEYPEYFDEASDELVAAMDGCEGCPLVGKDPNIIPTQPVVSVAPAP